jgi:hypothetical protein
LGNGEKNIDTRIHHALLDLVIQRRFGSHH